MATKKLTRRQKIQARAKTYKKDTVLDVCRQRFCTGGDVSIREKREAEGHCIAKDKAGAALLLAKADAANDPGKYQND